MMISKRRSYKIIHLFFVVILFLNGQVRAEKPVESELKDETTFFAIVNPTGGYINASLHQAFWEVMKGKYESKKREKVTQELQNLVELLKEFQMKTWQNAKASYYMGKNEKSKDYEMLKEMLLKQHSDYFSPPLIVKNADKIIEHAATKAPLDLGAGNFYVTPELIDENMAGMKGSFERLHLLLNPSWQENYKEYVLPGKEIKLLSLYAPDEYHEKIQHNDEKIDITISQLSVNKDAVYEIGTIDYQHRNKRFDHFTKEEKEIYLQEFLKEQFASYQIDVPSLSKGLWRGYEFTKAIANVDNFSIIMMGFFTHGKAIYIKYITAQNLASAGNEFNEFTQKVQVLEEGVDDGKKAKK